VTQKLPVYQQETPYSCMAACLRIVLAHLGVEVDEDALRERSYTTLWGTSITDAVACARAYRLTATWTEEAGSDDLARWLEEGLFPILVVRLTHLGHGSKHAVVVEEMAGDQLTYIDPADGRRHTISREMLEQAWQLAGGEAVLITSPDKEIEV
jgi:ABC-type bacteriocin/lantibiotic exporter with double-glycine peptidase domain